MWGLHPDYFDALFAGVVTLVPLLLGVYLCSPLSCYSSHPRPGGDRAAAAAGRGWPLPGPGLQRGLGAGGAGEAAGQVLYCTVLYCTVLYCTVLYCTVLARRRHLGLVYTLASLAVATYLANLYLAEAVIFE